MPQLAALNGGIHAAFSVAAVISIGALICSFFMRTASRRDSSRRVTVGASEPPVSDEARSPGQELSG